MSERQVIKLNPIPNLDDPNTKWVCEEHPNREWPHLQDGKDCPGPGMLVKDEPRNLAG